MSQSGKNKAQTENWYQLVTAVLSSNSSLINNFSINHDSEDEFIHYLEQNGIETVLLELLEQNSDAHPLCEQLLQKLGERRRKSAIREVYKKIHIQKTLDLIAENQIQCLILKGTALAYSLYKKPYLRPRVDCDLLIAEKDKKTVEKILSKAEFNRSLGISGKLVSHQATYTQQDNGINYAYDIHWKISNSNAYADRFEFNDLNQRRTKLNGFDGNAFRLNYIDAMLHGIVHYYGHYSIERERLIWLYDLHLIALSFDHEDWLELLKQSGQRSLDPLLLNSLRLCHHTLNTPVPESVLKQLNESEQTLSEIEQLRLSGEHWSRIEQFRSDWASLNFSKRCLLIKEYLIPPADFVLKQNNSSNRLLLPFFYIKRLVKGGLKIISHSHRP